MTTPWTPTVSPGAGAGSGATVSVTGDDGGGSITVTTGTSPSPGELVLLTFGEPFAVAPQVAVIQYGGAWLNPAGASSQTALTVTVTETPTASTEYTFAYQLSPAANVFPYFPSGLTGEPFFTSMELANRLQIDPGTINMGAANLLTQLASDAVREDTLLQVDYIENDSIALWGNNDEALMLPQRPVTEVSSVTLDGQALVPVTPTATTPLMYDWRPSGALRRPVYGGGVYAREVFHRWPRGAVVQVTYSHGYQTVPSAMKRVALDLAAAAYANPELHKSERVGWVEWATEYVTMDLIPGQRSSLDIYRNVTLTV